MRPAPRIISPAAGQIAMLLRGVPASEQEIPLEAEVAVPTTLSWFVDGKFVGAAPADDRVWWTPSEGVHEIYVADTAGLSTRRKLEVRAPPMIEDGLRAWDRRRRVLGAWIGMLRAVLLPATLFESLCHSGE